MHLTGYPTITQFDTRTAWLAANVALAEQRAEAKRQRRRPRRRRLVLGALASTAAFA